MPYVIKEANRSHSYIDTTFGNPYIVRSKREAKVYYDRFAALDMANYSSSIFNRTFKIIKVS